MTKTNRIIHTPEGVRDIYGLESRRKLAVEEKILHVFYSYGYDHIQTPCFEFFDIFSKDRGSATSQEMFKFFDRDNNTLVLRPDMTPVVARCVAKYYQDDLMPLRLCYLERTFKNDSSYQGRLKERTETGAELIGDDCADADAEMIAMVIDSLRAAGLEDFQMEIGQVEFYRSLMDEAGLEPEAEEELTHLIENKNYFGAEGLLEGQAIDSSLKRTLLKLPGLFGSIEQVRQGAQLTDNPRALRAIERLEQVHRILEGCGLAEYVSYDLGMISQYRYYTGIIFKAYTYGTGDYIGTGGRYDKLLVQFGKDAPAVGVAIVVNRLMAALSRQGIKIPLSVADTVVLYENETCEAALSFARDLRSQGSPGVQSMKRLGKNGLEDYLEMARQRGFKRLWYFEKEGEAPREYEISDSGPC